MVKEEEGGPGSDGDQIDGQIQSLGSQALRILLHTMKVEKAPRLVENHEALDACAVMLSAALGPKLDTGLSLCSQVSKTRLATLWRLGYLDTYPQRVNANTKALAYRRNCLPVKMRKDEEEGKEEGRRTGQISFQVLCHSTDVREIAIAHFLHRRPNRKDPTRDRGSGSALEVRAVCQSATDQTFV